nr:hypothetical protein [Streptomyces sp. TLI_146]
MHLHAIPRLHGDVEDPRGGIRRILPGVGRRELPFKASRLCVLCGDDHRWHTQPEGESDDTDLTASDRDDAFRLLRLCRALRISPSRCAQLSPE